MKYPSPHPPTTLLGGLGVTPPRASPPPLQVPRISGTQSRAKPPTCRESGSERRRQAGAAAPRSDGAEGRTAEGRRGQRQAQPSATPGAGGGGGRPSGSKGAGSHPVAGRRGLAAVPPASHRAAVPRPSGSLEAPRLPEREVEPSPRRPRRRESSAAAGAAGADPAAAPRVPRGELLGWVRAPGTGRVCRAGGQAAFGAPRPATSGCSVQPGRRGRARLLAVVAGGCGLRAAAAAAGSAGFGRLGPRSARRLQVGSSRTVEQQADSEGRAPLPRPGSLFGSPPLHLSRGH